MPVGLPNVPQGVILRASRSRWTGFSITLSLFLAALALAPSACREASAPLGAAALPPDTTLDLASLPTDVIPDRYIVVFKSSTQDPPGLARQLVQQHAGRLRHAYAAALKGFAAALSDDAVAALSSDPNVAFIEPDLRVRLAAAQSNPSWALDRPEQRSLPPAPPYTQSPT